MNLVITSTAEQDLDEIETFISEDSPSAALRFLDSLSELFLKLTDMPGIGHKRAKCGKGIRSIAEGNYVIIYRLKDDNLEILRVLHGARDPERVIAEEPIEE